MPLRSEKKKIYILYGIDIKEIQTNIGKRENSNISNKIFLCKNFIY